MTYPTTLTDGHIAGVALGLLLTVLIVAFWYAPEPPPPAPDEPELLLTITPVRSGIFGYRYDVYRDGTRVGYINGRKIQPGTYRVEVAP